MHRRLPLLSLLAILSSYSIPLHSATLTVVPGTGNNCADLEGSFQECLDFAENNSQGDILEVTGGEYNLSATLVYVPALGENFPITIRNVDDTIPVLTSGLTVPCLRLEVLAATEDANADVTIENLGFIRCKDPGEDGGALAIYTDDADITLTRLSFHENESGEDGGALDINAGAVDAGDGSVSITSCTFFGNKALINGGFSVSVAGSGSLDFLNNDVIENSTSEGSGGGGGLFADIGDITISENLIADNQAVREGGGLDIGTAISSIVMTNNIVAGNQADDLGGGLRIGISIAGGSLTATNNTIFGNSSQAEGGGLYLSQDQSDNRADLFNNIVFGNQATEGDDIFSNEDSSGDGGTASLNLFNNNFDAGGFFSVCLANPPCTTVNGADSPTNLLEDPLLVDPANGNFALGENSPAIGTGDPNAPEMPDTDFASNPRPTTPGTNPDIGALQFQAGPSPTPTPTPSATPDIEGDGGCSLNPRTPNTVWMGWILLITALGLGRVLGLTEPR